MDLHNKSQLIQYLKENNLWAKKSLGQNFLVDEGALGKIVEVADLQKDDLVIEVGPGMGVLTEELVKHAGEVIAVEMDQELAELLNGSIAKLLTTPNPSLERRGAIQQFSNLTIVNSDILKVNVPELVGDRKYKVVANIPYYITSKILRLFLEQENKPESIVLLVQKEVAERICAVPGQMSVLAISVQYYGTPEIIDIVPKESFFPSPKVDSAILRIEIPNIKYQISNKNKNPNDKKGTDSVHEKEFFRLVNIGFASKRKTLANNLSAGYGIDKNTAADIIKSIGLNENIRAQELSVEEWKRLLESLTNKMSIESK